MLFNLLSIGQIAFLVIVPLIVVAIIVLVIFLIVRHKSIKTNFKYRYYKRIYKISMDNDYYLINDFLFKIDDTHVARVDHILFGDKYIYIVNDFYYPGDISGKENDKSIILIDQKGKKVYEDNPIEINKKLVRRLALAVGINPSLMIGVSLINDDCGCGIATSTKNFYIIQSKKFKQLVKAIESRNISEINKEQLAAAVKAIDKLNRRKKRGEQK